MLAAHWGQKGFPLGWTDWEWTHSWCLEIWQSHCAIHSLAMCWGANICPRNVTDQLCYGMESRETESTVAWLSGTVASSWPLVTHHGAAGVHKSHSTVLCSTKTPPADVTQEKMTCQNSHNTSFTVAALSDLIGTLTPRLALTPNHLQCAVFQPGTYFILSSWLLLTKKKHCFHSKHIKAVVKCQRGNKFKASYVLLLSYNKMAAIAF